MTFVRETATHIEDLPHRFEERAGDRGCDVCGWQPEDARHRAWEQAQVTARETANQSPDAAITRQFG